MGKLLQLDTEYQPTVSWSLEIAMAVRSIKYKSLIKMHDFDLFIECCKTRYHYDERIQATSLQWQELATKFQQAKGASYSYMAEYCLRRASGI